MESCGSIPPIRFGLEHFQLLAMGYSFLRPVGKHVSDFCTSHVQREQVNDTKITPSPTYPTVTGNISIALLDMYVI
jgi:hypothetical protein